ncbi:Low molecular weight phosphatase [Aureococcus anophagefferens]|nr:Low molecular weight phosphatase [Aureococcus anophagefferens]
MADGWLRHLRGGASVGVASAGIVGGTAVKPGAIAVMREAGLDPEDKVAWKRRAIFEDWDLDDPPAIDPGDLSEYRRVRDEVKAKCVELLAKLRDGPDLPAAKGVACGCVDFLFL